ncbi:hypothetical protein NX059_009360 [Plenodomus lindquistii]|nr:hypothetical protein NX059_009360 [Plenodomus lindquistii]
MRSTVPRPIFEVSCKHARGRDERAFVPLLVRAASVLSALCALSLEIKAKIDGGLPDRWLWLAMKKVAVLTTECLTFDLSIGDAEWLCWAMDDVNVLDADDDDDYFLGMEEDFILSIM